MKTIDTKIVKILDDSFPNNQLNKNTTYQSITSDIENLKKDTFKLETDLNALISENQNCNQIEQLRINIQRNKCRLKVLRHNQRRLQ